MGWPLGWKLGWDGVKVRDAPFQNPTHRPLLTCGHRPPPTPRPACSHTLRRPFALPTLSLYLLGLPKKGPGAARNREEAVGSLGALMGLKGLGTRWVLEPECGDGREGNQCWGEGWGTTEMFIKPSRVPGRRSVRSFEVLGFGAGRGREKKKMRKETRKTGSIKKEPGMQVRREKDTTRVPESGDLKEKNQSGGTFASLGVEIMGGAGSLVF